MVSGAVQFLVLRWQAKQEEPKSRRGKLVEKQAEVIEKLYRQLQVVS
jgi:hypothetical protein